MCALFIAILTSWAFADSPTTIVLKDVTVIDGTGGKPLSGQCLVMVDGRISDIESNSSFTMPTDALVYDLAGKVLIPGFVDLHIHYPENRSTQVAINARLLEFGITTILNPGARPDAGVELRARIRDGDHPGPTMFTAGRIIDYAPSTDWLRRWGAVVDSEQAMRQEIKDQASLGVDFIKIYKRLPAEMVKVCVDEAGKLGLPVIGHMVATTWTEATELGVDMLVHAGWETPMEELINLDNLESASDDDWYHAYADAPNHAKFKRLAATLLAHKVVVVPTLSVMMAGGLGRDAELLPRFRTELAPDADLKGWWGEGWRKRHPEYGDDVSEAEAVLLRDVYFPGLLAILHAYYKRGVKLGVGTDVGNAWMTPGFIYHHELQLYQSAGIPPLDIIKMASHNGAEALGILSERGTVEVGKAADLVILNKNPLDDIKYTLSIHMVIQNGKIVKQNN